MKKQPHLGTLFHLKDRFRRIGGFKGNPFLLHLNKIGFFNITIDKIHTGHFRIDKTAVIEV
jgi:hypothetical protein